MQASAGLRELAIVCSEDGEGLIDGDNTQPSKSKDQGWTATKVLEDALDESQASIDVLRKQAAERRAVADTIRSNMTENGVPSSVLDTGADILSAGGGGAAAEAAAAGTKSGASEVEQDQAYAELCRATDALALRFGRNTSLSEEDPDAKDADDRDFLELMCEQVIVPLKNGSVSSVDALATLKDMCERQNEIRGTEAYTLACEGAVSSDDLGLDGDVSPSSTPSGKASQQPPRMNISGFKPLPRDRADLSAAVANTNVRVSTLEGSLEAMQAKFDRMERRLKNRDNTIKRIPKREEDAAGGKGRMCSGGDDGGCVMS
jgi:prefoldin subunit 5